MRTHSQVYGIRWCIVCTLRTICIQLQTNTQPKCIGGGATYLFVTQPKLLLSASSKVFLRLSALTTTDMSTLDPCEASTHRWNWFACITVLHTIFPSSSLLLEAIGAILSLLCCVPLIQWVFDFRRSKLDGSFCASQKPITLNYRKFYLILLLLLLLKELLLCLTLLI